MDGVVWVIIVIISYFFTTSVRIIIFKGERMGIRYSRVMVGCFMDGFGFATLFVSHFIGLCLLASSFLTMVIPYSPIFQSSISQCLHLGPLTLTPLLLQLLHFCVIIGHVLFIAAEFGLANSRKLRLAHPWQ